MRHADLHLGGRVRIDRDVDHGFAVDCRLPDRSRPIAGKVGGIGDEHEGLVAVERAVGIDGGEIDLVLAAREIGIWSSWLAPLITVLCGVITELDARGLPSPA